MIIQLSEILSGSIIAAMRKATLSDHAKGHRKQVIAQRMQHLAIKYTFTRNWETAHGMLLRKWWDSL